MSDSPTVGVAQEARRVVCGLKVLDRYTGLLDHSIWFTRAEMDSPDFIAGVENEFLGTRLVTEPIYRTFHR